ncbi:MAG TPA: hypothetical protein VJ843_03565 [Candidatus Saccharimonadales bacterium]|nr:hypothetical protein [Candidatus Saccharimonadales bacterium]
MKEALIIAAAQQTTSVGEHKAELIGMAIGFILTIAGVWRNANNQSDKNKGGFLVGLGLVIVVGSGIILLYS